MFCRMWPGAAQGRTAGPGTYLRCSKYCTAPCFRPLCPCTIWFRSTRSGWDQCGRGLRGKENSMPLTCHDLEGAYNSCAQARAAFSLEQP